MQETQKIQRLSFRENLWAPLDLLLRSFKLWPSGKIERRRRTGIVHEPYATGQEIGDIDFSKVDPTAALRRVKCQRCEKEIPSEGLGFRV